MMNLFSRDKRTPYEKAKEQTQEVTSQIRREKRQLERQILQSEREIQRLSSDIRKHAQNGNKEALRTLAKAIVKIRHDKSHLYSAIANLDTIDSAVKSQLTNVRITGVMQKSSQIAQSLSDLMKVEQFQGISEQFSRELVKMGIVGEMINESVENAMSNDDLEEETDEEVNKVLGEILIDKVRQIPTVVKDDPTPVRIGEVESEEDEFAQRLQALKS